VPHCRWGGGYRTTPHPDPVYLCTDDVIGILPERNLNNGQPSLHAALIAAAAPQPGEHVVHVGAGVGYYTAILAELVGVAGRVTAIEFDPELAARARANLAQTPHVRAVHGDGTRAMFEPADVIRVNAGATRPADAWLDRLKEGGRLILPLTADGFPNCDVRRGHCRGRGTVAQSDWRHQTAMSGGRLHRSPCHRSISALSQLLIRLDGGWMALDRQPCAAKLI
jgi:protein-L-isoaspartate(D-aspartate) O-methyltransferase